MIMFPCSMLSTKFNIKQKYTVKLIDRNNSNKNPILLPECSCDTSRLWKIRKLNHKLRK